MAYLKLMMDEKEIAHLSEDGQSLCANEGVPQYDLPLNLFIGNEDRHENNFDVIVRDGKNYAPPIYDNGGSLLAWATDEELTDTKLRYQFDKAKPFRSHHAQQIKMIDEPVLPTRDLDELYSEITQSISPILALLSEKRAAAIRQYLKYRLHYLKAAMG